MKYQTKPVEAERFLIVGNPKPYRIENLQEGDWVVRGPDNIPCVFTNEHFLELYEKKGTKYVSKEIFEAEQFLIGKSIPKSVYYDGSWYIRSKEKIKIPISDGDWIVNGWYCVKPDRFELIFEPVDGLELLKVKIEELYNLIKRM